MIANKQLGQHFLRDSLVLREFVKQCQLTKNDSLLEIGGGTGIITVNLAPLVKDIVVAELDQRLFKRYLLPLEKRFPNLTAINGDILSLLDGDQFAHNYKQDYDKIVGAIPYQITSPLLRKIVSNYYPRQPRPRIVFLMQWEVALRIASRPPKASFLSNLVSLYGEAKVVGGKIAPRAFDPPPKVFSAILTIAPYDSQPLKASRLESFARFLRHGFKNPRKMLKKTFPSNILEQCQISPTARPQELPLDSWLALFAIQWQATE